MQSRGVRLSVNFYTQVATSTTQDSIATKLAPNSHTMVPTWAYVQGVLKVEVKGHVIRALL